MRLASRILIPWMAIQIVMIITESPLYSQSTVFTDETAGRLPQIIDMSHDADFGDFDRDGDLDVFVSNRRYWGAEFANLLLLNDGAGYFSADTTGMLPTILTEINRSAIGDIERDGDFDIFVAVNGDWNLLLVNDGSSNFIDEGEERLPAKVSPWPSTGAFFTDVDSDMDLDFIVTNFNSEPNLLRLNDGSGFFSSANDQFPSSTDNSADVVCADIEGDFDIDGYVAYITFGGGDRLMVNDGSGHFTDVSGIQIPQDDNDTNGATFGDVDRDGDFDLVIANSFFASNRIFINRGNGYFDDRTGDLLPLDSAASIGVTLGDIDNDGDLDLLIANHASAGTKNLLYVNNGSGRFTDQTSLFLPVEDTETDILLLGDVDGDGDLDIFECNHSQIYLNPVLQEGAQNRLLINNSTPDSFPPIIPRTYQHQDTGDTTNPYLITTTAWDNISVIIGEFKVSLFYRSVDDTVLSFNETEFIEVSMLDCGGFLYRGRIPAQSSVSTVEYYIKAEDRMGNVSYDPPDAPDSVFTFLVDVNVGIDNDPLSTSLPKTFSLSQNYPNPFNPSTTISYAVPEGKEQVKVRISIYNLRGQLVKVLVDKIQSPGRYTIHWNGTNQHGEEVSSGVYLYRIVAEDFISTRKMVLLE